MKGKLKDLTGQRFGRLLVLKLAGKSNDNHYKWLCQCDCGNTKIIIGRDITSGKTKSCGCFARQLTSIRTLKHNMHGTKIYHIWISIKQRCNNSNNHKYKDYGGRGIKICKGWENDFMSFYNWSINNGYKEGLSIDRINNDGNYEPQNCRWVTMKEQANNRRNNHYIVYKSEIHTITEWSRIIGISSSTIQRRIKKEIPENLLFYLGKITPKIRKEYEDGKIK